MLYSFFHPPLQYSCSIFSFNTTTVPPPRRTAAAMKKDEGKDSQKKSRGGGRRCCRCFFFCCCLLLLIIAILIMTYFFFLPKTPDFAIRKISVKSLDFSPVSGITAKIRVAVEATNPNKNIGVVYGQGGSMTIQYDDVNLCEGELPSFQQKGASSRVFDVELTGETPFRLELLRALVKQRKDRRIPVTLKMRVPVSMVAAKLRLKEFKVLVDFSLVVDGFSSDMAATILSTETSYRVDYF